MNDFWSDLGQITDADYIVAATIDVKVLDRAGYTTEEYVSPADGKTYFRQVLVEETGFKFDVLPVNFMRNSAYRGCVLVARTASSLNCSANSSSWAFRASAYLNKLPSSRCGSVMISRASRPSAN